eukprot:CAMPEP_0176166284 /NCGR_PEP_ID=MMETSP0120_2-20121206/85042_1 /TAXON_ID=160619 /ORGANISM="Kryptoperidinium foliaceum, Strain CCMP 1326" /LENGTH=828 /DNA_ID=CAMNT_0017503817 /DNA_START=67 /DNA_END=2549 /DNA_ORIENTATION=+
MGNCSSAPRMKVNLRSFMAPNPSAEGCGDDWYFDTMNLLLDRWAYSHVQFLRKRFLEATGGKGEKELDKKGFFKLFAELQDMPKAVAESAFRMFDTDNSGKLNFREFCCALALCCHLMSSDDEKIRFVFDMFDTNDDGLLSANDVQLLLDHALQKDARCEEHGEEKDVVAVMAKRQLRIAEIKQELLGSSQHLTFERFNDWAQCNLDSLNNLLHTFQIVPSPERERTICEEILSRHQSLQEGSTWYCISHKWLQVWKAHAGWTGPSPGRRVQGTPSAPQQPPFRLAAAYAAPVGVLRAPSPAVVGDSGDDEGSEEMIAMMSDVGMGAGHHHILTRPPEIDNSDLEGEHKGELKMNLVEHLDYELIPEEMWWKLVEWYGGGPAIMRKVICMGQDQQPQVELYPPLVLVVVAGESGQPLPQFSRRFFISRQSSIAEVLQMLAEKLTRPIERSRLWHRSKGDQWRLVEQMSATLEEFLEGKVWDAGAFLLETQTPAGEWPRGSLPATDTASEGQATAALTDRELQRHFEVGDRVEGTPPMRGATGLRNLGNTCFMNATIQCMANTPLLKEYFLSTQYLRDLNDKGLGCKGRLAEEFGQVVSDLWAGKSSVLTPRNLKRTIDQFAPQFAGYEQHDSQEFLAFFLDGLHEDLNRLGSGGSSSTRSGLGLGIRRDPGTPKLFSRNKQIRGPPGSPLRARPAWKDRGVDSTPGSSSAGGGSAGGGVVPAAVTQVVAADLTPPATSEKDRDGSSDASDAASSAGGVAGANQSVAEIMAEAFPLRSLETIAAEASVVDDSSARSMRQHAQTDLPVEREPRAGFAERLLSPAMPWGQG